MDLEHLIQITGEKGAIAVTHIMWDKFLRAAKFIDFKLEDRISVEELRLEYRHFLHVLEDLSDDVAIRKMSSLDLLAKLLHPDSQLYQNIETVMSVIVTAALVRSVEACVEGWMSVLERHSSKTRGLSQDRLELEMWIALNGPDVVHCAKVIEEALSDYWNDTHHQFGHFVRKSENIKSYIVSKSVDNLRKKVPRNPAMV